MDTNSRQNTLIEKQKELESLRQLATLTENLKHELDDLSNSASKINSNAEDVRNVTDHWNSIMRSISQASLKILQYASSDYEVDPWKNLDDNKGKQDMQNKDEIPLPETLVRIRSAQSTEKHQQDS